MFDFLPSSEDVIAVRVGGKLDRAALNTLVDRFEKAIEARDVTHIFVEVSQFSGMELEGFSGYFARAAGLLGKIGRMGRVAVVADQPWVRWASSIESALLPGVTYEVYLPEERERALAWVEGKEARPHGPALSIIETDSPSVAGFEIDGKLTAEEVEKVSDYFEELMKGPGKFRLLGRVKRLGGFELKSMFDENYFEMKRAMLDRLDRYALVGGPAWLRYWAKMLDPLFRVEIRHFEANEEALAWAWLGAHPKAERPLVA